MPGLGGGGLTPSPGLGFAAIGGGAFAAELPGLELSGVVLVVVAAGFGAGFFLNSRGLFMPRPLYASDAWIIGAALVIGLVGTVVFRRWAKTRQAQTGRQYPVGKVTLALVAGLPIIAWLLLGLVATNPISFDMPQKGTFNLRGGMQILPEFVALLVGLVTYTAAFIAEVVRAGILAVSKGQTEAARSLGMPQWRAMVTIVIPQAFRIVLPPLTNEVILLTKDSSLIYVLGLTASQYELTKFGRDGISSLGAGLTPLPVAGAFYLVITIPLSFLARKFESRSARTKR